MLRCPMRGVLAAATVSRDEMDPRVGASEDWGRAPQEPAAKADGILSHQKKVLPLNHLES